MKKIFESGKSNSKTAGKIQLHWAFWKKSNLPEVNFVYMEENGKVASEKLSSNFIFHYAEIKIKNI